MLNLCKNTNKFVLLHCNCRKRPLIPLPTSLLTSVEHGFQMKFNLSYILFIVLSSFLFCFKNVIIFKFIYKTNGFFVKLYIKLIYYILHIFAKNIHKSTQLLSLLRLECKTQTILFIHIVKLFQIPIYSLYL